MGLVALGREVFSGAMPVSEMGLEGLGMGRFHHGSKIW